MFFLVYVSSAVKLFSPSELISLMAKSQENNAKKGITGMLLYKGGNFMQLLEGEEELVRNLFHKIAVDQRHQGEMVLLQGQSEERQFPTWSMGFRDMNSPQTLNLPGYNEFLSTELTGEEFSSDPTRAQKLLLLFKKNM